jgi:hypothetical protein
VPTQWSADTGDSSVVKGPNDPLAQWQIWADFDDDLLVQWQIYADYDNDLLVQRQICVKMLTYWSNTKSVLIMNERRNGVTTLIKIKTKLWTKLQNVYFVS